MTACCECSIRTRVSPSLRLIFMYLHTPVYCALYVASQLSTLWPPPQFGVGISVYMQIGGLTYIFQNCYYPRTLLHWWVFVVFIHIQNNRYFRSLYKRAFPHDLWLIGAFDQRGFAPVGHCIQQVAFDHYRRTSLVHRPYTR